MNFNYNNSLTVITGPMYSAKTEYLLYILNRLDIANQRKIIFSHSINTRDGDYIKSRGSDTQYRSQKVNSTEELLCVLKTFMMIQPKKDETLYVIIDEVQFFDKSLVELIRKTIPLNIKYIVSGLDLNYKEESFGIMGDLLCLSDEVIKLKAICFNCGCQYANRTHIKGLKNNMNGAIMNSNDVVINNDDVMNNNDDINNNNTNTNNNDVMIEGEDQNLKFEALCTNCLKEIKKKNGK